MPGLADGRRERRLEVMTNGAHGSGDECLVIGARAPGACTRLCGV